jgi:4-amino-4-deoxy-L-arabinose transferase-like glycosyltransferase
MSTTSNPAVQPVDAAEVNTAALRWAVAAFGVALPLLFYKLGELPLQLWDESRLANSALEMARDGLSLVTTYEGRSDHWGTKPPLVIWMMALSVQFFGPDEWALRLPSVLAALATMGIVFAFCTRQMGSPFIGFVAIMVMLGARGYMGHHGVRYADYESTLMLCTTGYVLAGYMVVHGDAAQRHAWLAACFAGVLLAVMTKTVQGLIFLPALVVYAAWHGRLLAVLRDRRTWFYLFIVLSAWLSYYLARERVDPGYIAASIANDFQRFSSLVDTHPERGPLFYWADVHRFYWLVPSLVFALVFALRGGPGEAARAAAWVGGAAFFYMVIISIARTKLSWYSVPVIPLLAIVVGAAAAVLTQQLALRTRRDTGLWPCLLAAVCALLVVRTNIVHVDHMNRHTKEVDQYSRFLRGPAFDGLPAMDIVIVHTGHHVRRETGPYFAPTLFYAQRLALRGHKVRIAHPSAPLPEPIEHLVACGGIARALLPRLQLQVITEQGSCALYRAT